MHCRPQKTVEPIVKSEHHDCIGLKGNQKTLLHTAQQLTQVEPPLSEFQESDIPHGRTVHRTVRVFAAPESLSQPGCGLEAIVAVQRQGVREGRDFHRHSWFILSQVIPAEQAAALIRNHRGSLENKLY